MSSFDEIWDAAQHLTIIGRQRAELLHRLARMLAGEGGEIWECGVYRGGSALVLAAAAGTNTVRLFDTFHGLPAPDPGRDFHREGDFGDTSLDQVAAVFTNHAHVILYPGTIPETFAGLESHRIALLHLDVDLYASVRTGLEWCYPWMLPTGAIVIDDYGFPSCPGATAATDEFFVDRPEKPVLRERGSALIPMAGVPSEMRPAMLALL
jgi:O-methyltransferase